MAFSLKSYLPKSIFGRSLLIITVPIVVMQMLVAYFFFNAHWDTVTANLTESVAADVAVATELYRRNPTAENADQLDALLRPDMQLSVRLKPDEDLPVARRRNFFSVLDKSLRRALTNSLDQPFWFDTTRYPNHIDIRVRVEEGVLQFYASRDRAFAPTGFVFIFWLVTATLLLTLVSIIYIRRQSLPIRDLADAADAFGKGQDISGYKPYGAVEVRRAGQSFLKMRSRIRRHLEQRTLMLAGVSHDLRTPLTRLKLALEVAETPEDLAAVKRDVFEMEAMLSAYLDFAHGTGQGEMASVDVAALLRDIGETLAIDVTADGPIIADLSESQIRRAVTNLAENGLKYAENVKISLETSKGHVTIHVDDAGPGIPADKHEEVLKPFSRLDEARSQNVEGVGLGLAIARDIAQMHGGRLVLGKSVLGGLRASLILPT